ncbi:MAG: lipopolysaccharide biosynthesis protein, partial [Flavobacterium sp.]|nr:lipopolysaccharide biosynthesis protein [Flavobacterium sp.]
MALFYNQPILTNIIRVNSFSFIIIAFSTIQNSILVKNLKFKKLLIISIPSNCIGGIVGILLAFLGYGVWSLVMTSLVTLSLTSVFLWILSDWRPKLVFNIEVFKKHFYYGYKLTLTNFINAAFTNSYLVLIGKLYNPSQVGYYSRADSMRNISVYSILNALNRVSFPLIASIQDNTSQFKKTYKNLLQSVFFTITPILVLLAVLAKPLFVFLFTDKWIFAVPYFQILILSSILFTLNSVNTSVLSSVGKSNLVLKIEVIKLLFAIITIASAFSFGIIWLLYTQVILSIVDFIIIGYFIKKTFSFSVNNHLIFIFLTK